MHSRIFQVGYEPIPEEDFTDCDYYDDRIPGADYVAECDREDAINWLSGYLKECAKFECVNGKWFFKLNNEFKSIYFKEKYAKFIETAKRLSEITIEDFSNGSCSFAVFELQMAYDHDYSFYIDFEDDVDTLDNFMRNAAPNTAYYIGAAFDYHS